MLSRAKNEVPLHLSHVDEYLTLKYKYKYKYSGHKYKYFKMVLEYYSSTSTSTNYYISAVGCILSYIVDLQRQNHLKV